MSQTLNGLPLCCNDNLIWEDETDWSPLDMEKRYGQTGDIIVQSGLKRGGRPVTLKDDWATRSQLDALFGTMTSPGPHLLDLDGHQLRVYWDATQTPIEATPLNNQTRRWDDPDARYEVRFRFFTAD